MSLLSQGYVFNGIKEKNGIILQGMDITPNSWMNFQ